MYNLHSHYETIFHSLKHIVTYRRVLYLLPYGSTQPENLERIADNIGHTSSTIQNGPMFVCYDQEPLLGDYNFKLFDHIVNTCQGPFILVTTEKDSEQLEQFKQRYNWPVVYYFHHAFAAHDWYRGYRYDARLLPPQDRTINKKFICLNRITSGYRAYRSLLIADLADKNLISQGHVSYNDICPEGGDYTQNLTHLVERKLISTHIASQAINTIRRLPLPLRVDFQDHEFIPNHSFALSAVEQTQESFCYLVTETCYWEQKKHLTEKIFKPIVSRMPFVLVGPAHNLKYLREYGFKTFGKWIDESYDDIEDPIKRMSAIGETMSKICSKSEDELYEILQEMAPVLEHNYQRFYSNEFLDLCWEELMFHIKKAVNEV
jgi:hypothetical protein